MSIAVEPRLHFRPMPQYVPSILVVEDEPLVRMALADFLEEAGFAVQEATCAADARALIDADEEHFDLVFTDIRMPGDMDGFGLAGWVKRYHPGLPVMLCSGDHRKIDVASHCGHSVLRKPFELHAVVAQIRQSLEDGQQSGAL